MKFGVGQSVRRTEDPRLVTGAGAFTDDVNLEGQLYVAFYRSPHAHARLRAIHLDEARASADVVVVYTAPDGALGGLRGGAPGYAFAVLDALTAAELLVISAAASSAASSAPSLPSALCLVERS